MDTKKPKKQRILKKDKPKKSREELLREFNAASHDTLFAQNTVAAVRACSEFTIERERTAGNGIPYLKIVRQVRYRKADIITWINKQNTSG